MLRFLVTTVSVTLLLAATAFWGSRQGWWFLPTYTFEILFFILFMTVLVFYYLNNLRNRQPQAFSQFYLLSIALKMLGGLTLISFIVWDDPQSAIGNVILFIASYLILTFLEVYFLMSQPAR